MSLPDGPEYHCHQHDDIDDEAAVERQAQCVHKQQLEPSTHLHNARYNAVEHGSHEDKRADECVDGALERGALGTLIIVNKHERRQAEEVEQVHADAEAREVGDEDEPAVGVWLVGVVLPLQHQPEHQGGEQRAVSIDLAFHSRVPEGVAPAVGQRARHGGGFYGDELRQRLHPSVLAEEFASQVGDGPIKEHDAQGAQ